MFTVLGQVEDRSWLIPSCPGCPPRPHTQQKPTYEDLRRSGESGCEKCKLFARGIAAICPAGARLRKVEWIWNYSVLTGRHQRHGDEEDPGVNTESVYEIEFFIHQDSKALFVSDSHLPTEFHVGNPVPEATDLEETITQIQNWYSSCVSSHDNCNLISGTYVPTRLLDIQSPDCVSKVRLLETQADILGSPIDYVCLSHCWAGILPACITLKSTLEQNLREIPWASIPKTFQDVIGVLRSLAFRYLWIDSMCIIQDDSDDWAREAAAMCSVYSQAALTVAATNSPNSRHGLHSTISPAFQYHKLSMVLTDGTNLPVWGRRPIPHFKDSETHNRREVEVPPLLQRGWVLQERLISRRVVHFALNEVVWECLHMSECQCLASAGERFVNPKVLLGAFLHGPHTEYRTAYPASQWLEILEEYTSLALTFARDRFPALSGAAQLSRQFRNGDKYVAGLWEGEMLLGLTWSAGGLLQERPREWVAPTWSWASIDSVVWWSAKFLQVAQGFLTSMKADCVLAGPDPTGRLSSASLTVRGPMATGVLLWEDTDARNDRMFSVQFGPRKITGCFLPDYTLHTSTDERLVPNASEVRWLAVLDVLLPIESQHEYAGLILRESWRDPQMFERIGILRTESNEDHEFIMERATETELVIL
ncbi:heterokaryon incompatibility protein-domain-containing protein [Xylaria flabelliformis]|nr:heterokaryon incompatibility protein-domain-containing protein [Xylaria flabelliformis]